MVAFLAGFFESRQKLCALALPLPCVGASMPRDGARMASIAPRSATLHRLRHVLLKLRFGHRCGFAGFVGKRLVNALVG